jgi:hypothetical protein
VGVQEPLELLSVKLPHGQAAAPVDGAAELVVLVVVAVEVVVQVLAVEVLVLVVVGVVVLAHVAAPFCQRT